MVGSRRQGWAIYARDVRAVRRRASRSSTSPRPRLARPARWPASPGGNLEGKEDALRDRRLERCSPRSRPSPRAARSTRAMESLTGIGGAVPMANMMTGEVIFGGVGSGLYGMLLFVLLAVFLAGLMVGRTPGVPRQEDRGARDQARRDRDDRGAAARARSRPRVAIAHEVRRAVDLRQRARRASPRRSTPTSRRRTTTARRSPATPASCSRTAATSAPSASRSPTSLGGVAMLVGRFAADARSRSPSPARSPASAVAPAGPGTMRTDTPTFVVLLIAIVLLVALLTFVPALLLGPVVQGLTDQALLMLRAICRTAARRGRRLHDRARPRLPAAVTGVGQVAVPRRRRTARSSSATASVVGSRLIGQDFRTDPPATSRPPVGDRLRPPTATFFNNLGPNQSDLADAARQERRRRTWRWSGPTRPARAARDDPAGRRDDLGVGRRPAHLRRERARSRRSRVARGPRHAARRGSRS